MALIEARGLTMSCGLTPCSYLRPRAVSLPAPAQTQSCARNVDVINYAGQERYRAGGWEKYPGNTTTNLFWV